MLMLFKQLTAFCKLDDIQIDNNVFRLHYKATVIVFLAASLMVTSKQYFGDPIDCIVDGSNSKLMDTYCWIHSTFTIPNKIKGDIGFDIPYHGIAPISDLETNGETKYHSYYQWVCFFLFLEAAFFYIPRFLWNSSEGGKIKMLIQNLKEPLLPKKDQDEAIELISNYLYEQRGSHGLYAVRFFACEILNFVNSVCQIYFIDFFLNYEFSNYGTRVLEFMDANPLERDDPMHLVFPKMTKCNFWKYGSSGTIENKDGFCVLSLNIINEKIFVFLWFWMIVLAAVSGIFLIYRLAVILGPQIRVALITFQGGKSTKKSDVEFILQMPNHSFTERIGDWFVLYLVCKNLDILTVNQLIASLCSKFDARNNAETMKLKPSTTSTV